MAGNSETGAQLLARLGSRPSLQGLSPHLFGDAFPKPGDLVELCGESGTAKTELLLNFIASCILPEKWKDYTIGGVGTGVVFIDTHFQFSMLRIFSLLEKKVTSSIKNHRDVVHTDDIRPTINVSVTKDRNQKMDSPHREGTTEIQRPPGPSEVESFIKTCLERLYLVRCNSSQQLLVTLYSLENFFANRSEMSVFMIDSWTAFYWMDRAGFGDQMSLLDGCQKNLAKAVERLLTDNNITAFVTKGILFRSGSKFESCQEETSRSPSSRQVNVGTDKSSNYQDFGLKEWNKLISHRFMLTRSEHSTTGNSNSSSADHGSSPRTVFTATRFSPRPVKTETFIVSCGGLEFDTTARKA